MVNRTRYNPEQRTWRGVSYKNGKRISELKEREQVKEMNIYTAGNESMHLLDSLLSEIGLWKGGEFGDWFFSEESRSVCKVRMNKEMAEFINSQDGNRLWQTTPKELYQKVLEIALDNDYTVDLKDDVLIFNRIDLI